MFRFLRRLRARVKYRHFERDLAEEIETHRVLRQADLVSAGHSPEDARTNSYRELGNIRVARENGRAIWIARWLDGVRQDLRYALRGLRRRPGFALTAISILGLSTGLLSSVVIFADATLLRPWRVPDPDRVGLIRSIAATSDDLAVIRISEYREIAPTLTTWTGIALAERGASRTLTFENGSTETVGALYVTRNYFDTLAMPIRNGRTFTTAEDDDVLPERAIVISHRLWVQDLDAEPRAVGGTVRIGKGTYTIVGVAPDGFIDGLGSRYEAWLPFALDLGDTPDERRAYLDPRHSMPPLNVIGRVEPGVSREQALSELTQRSDAYRKANAIDVTAFALIDTRPLTLGFHPPLNLLLLPALALGLIHLLACANVGNLLLANGLTRRREIAVRLAIGAGRLRVVRQLLTEAAVLMAIAATIGLSTALLVPRLVLPFLPRWDERPEFYTPGLATSEILLALLAASTVIIGVVPAFRSAPTGLSPLANDRHDQTRSGIVLRRILLAAQIALATVLVSAAGLLTRGVTRALQVDPGFPIHEFQDLRIDLAGAGNDRDRRANFFRDLIAETHAADWPPNTYAALLPIDDTPYGFPIRFTDPSGIHMLQVLRRNVWPNYFQTLGVPLLKGRMPSPESEGREVVLNESAAALIFPGKDAIGGTFSTVVAQDWTPVTVVGLVRDLPVTSVVDSAPTAYAVSRPFIEHLLVRSLDPTVAGRVSAIAKRLDPAATIVARPLVDDVAETLDAARMGDVAAWAISAIGLTLATIGAFGVFAYVVEERRREVGIRMALGARASQVVRFVLKSSQWTMLAGLGAGLIMTIAVSPLLRAHLYGLSAFDPVTYLEVGAILSAAATLATWIPARRATRINPVEALRAD